MKQIDLTQNQFTNSELEQIEEMAKVIKSSMENLGCGNFNFTGDEISTMFAKALYNAGYRKQSEVASEIFEEIDDLLSKAKRVSSDEMAKAIRNQEIEGFLVNVGAASLLGAFKISFAELKKKYTEG